MAPKYHLTYFDITGIGEPIRMLFYYGGIDFTETRILREDWPTVKPTMEPLQQLPVLDYNGKRFYQSTAIARYLAKQVGLAGDNDLEAYEIDAVVDTVTDFRLAVATCHFEPNPVKKAELKETLYNEKLPFYLGVFNEWAKKNNDYLANGKLSLADIVFVTAVDYLSYLTGKDLLSDTYSNLIKVKENVYSTPGIKEWIEKRPKDTFFD